MKPRLVNNFKINVRAPNIIVINFTFLLIRRFSFPLSALEALIIILSKLISVKKKFCCVLGKKTLQYFTQLSGLGSLKFQSYFYKIKKEMFYRTILS